MAQIITAEDVASFTKNLTEDDVAVLVAGINAKAARVAPCLADAPTEDQIAEAKLILIGAVKRWAEAGSGAFSQQTIGPSSVSIDTRQRQGGYNLWPSEIEALQDLCADPTADADSAFMVNMIAETPGPDLANRPDLWLQWGRP